MNQDSTIKRCVRFFRILLGLRSHPIGQSRPPVRSGQENRELLAQSQVSSVSWRRVLRAAAADRSNYLEADPEPGTPDARRLLGAGAHAPPPDGAGPGSEVSRGRLLQDRVVEHRLGQELLQPGVLSLEPLQPPRLVHLHPGVFLAPAVVGRALRSLAYGTPGASRALRQLNVRLPQLGDDLFDRVALPTHLKPLSQPDSSAES